MAKTSPPKESPQKHLKALIDASSAPDLSLVISPDAIRRRRLAEILIEKLPPSLDRRESVIRLSCEELSVSRFGSLKSELSSYSLFSTERIFILDHVEALNAALAKELALLVSDLAPGTKVCLLAEKLPSTSAILKACKARSVVWELEELKGFELKRWLQKELRTAGIPELAEPVLEALLHLGEGSPDNLAPLVERLSLFSDGAPVTLDDLGRLFPGAVDQSEYELLDDIINGNPARMEVGIERMARSGKNQFGFLSLVNRQFSNLFFIKSMEQQGRHSAFIRESLAIQPWLFNKLQASARRYSLRELRGALSALLRADSQFKNRSTGVESVLSDLLSRLAPGRRER